MLGLGACDLLFQIEHTNPTADDAAARMDGTPGGPDGTTSFPHCSNNLSFGAKQYFDGLGQTTVGSVPTTRGDLLEIFWLEKNPYYIYRATRTAVDQPFVTDPNIVSFSEVAGDPNVFNDDPALTADGLEVIFISNRDATSTKYAYIATRPTVDASWSTPTILTGNVRATITSLDLSWDGLTLYYVDSVGNLYQTQRIDRQSPFQSAIPLGVGITYPTLSSDGLELFGVASGTAKGVVYATRHKTTDMFPSLTVLVGLQGELDVDLTPDGQILVVGGGGYFQRSCQ